ncbi:MAG: BamA/TamA family outer membrane protein, partial [Gemmatimonadetes bacterium]|nr:BamA/TamA family outer membrane protein [Gemmatimonadota bacterium]
GAGPADAKLAPLPGAYPADRSGPQLLQRTLEEGSGTSKRWARSDGTGGPLAPVRVDDGVLFRIRDEDARRVSIVGDFNDWNENATRLRRTRHGLWRTVLPLKEGTWPYLFVVDGDWILDPDNPLVEADPSGDAGGEASVVELRHGEVIAPRHSEFQEGEFALTGSYDRVNEVTLASKLRYENRAQLHPELTVGTSYSFGRERWLYSVGIAQPVFASEALDVGIRVYRATATPDEHRMGDTENSLATFFFREDWRDYHEAEGIAAFATVYLGPVTRLTGRWKGEDHTSVSKNTDWGLFGGEKRMRANPAVDEGELRAVAVEVDVDTRNSVRNPTRGFYARTSWEQAGGTFGGDFGFRRATAEFRRYLKLSRGHFFDFRLAAGRMDDGERGASGGVITGFDAVPVQERFYLGGTGTMRATQFKSLSGDRMLLGNAEMRVEVFKDFQAVAFVDLGDSWIDGARNADLKTDAGIGFQDSDASFRLNVAKKVDGRPDDDGIFVSARIQRMF